jgi:hypothetical protein
MKNKNKLRINQMSAGWLPVMLTSLLMTMGAVSFAGGRTEKVIDDGNGNVTIAPLNTCLSEGFENFGFPYNGWNQSNCQISNLPADVKSGTGALIMHLQTGYFTMPAVSQPNFMKVNIGRGTANVAKTLNIQVSTTSAVSGFTTIATYDHSNIPAATYYQYTIDLSAYAAEPNVWIRFEKVSASFGGRWRIDNLLVDCNGCVAPVINTQPTDQVSCDEGTVSYSVAAVGTSLTYQWERSTNGGATWLPMTNGGVISGVNSATLVYSATTAVMAGFQHRCVVSGACGSPVTSSVAGLSLSETPVAGPVSGVAFVCQPFPVQHTYSINSVPNATSYTWSFVPGTQGVTFIGSTSDTSVTVEFSNTPNSTYVIRVTANNACGSSPFSNFLVRKNISVPLIAGTPTACAGSTQIYSIANPVSGAASYTWNAPPGCLINGSLSPVTTTGTSVSIQFHSLFVSGTVCVVANDQCGVPTIQRCINIGTIPNAPSNVVGGTSVCPGSTGVVFSTNAVSGATYYNWSLPAGATIASGFGTNEIEVDFGASFVSGGTICVQAVNGCGFSAQTCKTINFNFPSRPANFDGLLFGVCNSAQYYEVPPVPGATTYTWTVPSGAVIVSGQGNSIVNIDFTTALLPANICVTASNACGSGPERCQIVKSVPANPVVNGPNAVCANEFGVSYDALNFTPVSNYTWTVPSGANLVFGQGSSSIIVDYGSNGGNVTVKATNSCGQSGTTIFPVVVNCRTGNEVEEQSLNVYPNPANEELNIRSETMANGQANLALFDVTGRMVFSSNLQIENATLAEQIDLRTLTKGIYLLKVIDANGQISQQKIVKK